MADATPKMPPASRRALRDAVAQWGWPSAEAEQCIAGWAARGADADAMRRRASGLAKAAPPGALADALETARRCEESLGCPPELPDGWKPRPRGGRCYVRLFLAALLLGARGRRFAMAANATAKLYWQTFAERLDPKRVREFWEAAERNGLMRRVTARRGSSQSKWTLAEFRLDERWRTGYSSELAAFASEGLREWLCTLG